MPEKACPVQWASSQARVGAKETEGKAKEGQEKACFEQAGRMQAGHEISACLF